MRVARLMPNRGQHYVRGHYSRDDYSNDGYSERRDSVVDIAVTKGKDMIMDTFDKMLGEGQKRLTKGKNQRMYGDYEKFLICIDKY